MNELLQKILSSDVLTEETRAELETALKATLEEAVSAARQEATAAVTAELHEQWIHERDVLIEALDAQVSDMLKAEIAELNEDWARFRDLEVEYAVKLEEAKEDMAESMKQDLATLITELDSFLNIRLAQEMEDLQESIADVRKIEFGRKVFEAFASEYQANYASNDSLEGKLNEAEQELQAKTQKLEEAEKRLAEMEREKIMEQVLTPLSGRARDVMEAILQRSKTADLEETYKAYVGHVIKETTVTPTDKQPITESVTSKRTEVSGAVKTGNDESLLAEHAAEDRARQSQANSLPADTRRWLAATAGLAR